MEQIPFEIYLDFLNNLGFTFIAILNSTTHHTENLAGWKGLKSLTCLDKNNEIYDIDIRYAWSSKIFKQNLFDYGWNEKTISYIKNKGEANRHKLIIYLCKASTGVKQNKIDAVPSHFIIGNYWLTIHHFYLLLPPFYSSYEDYFQLQKEQQEEYFFYNLHMHISKNQQHHHEHNHEKNKINFSLQQHSKQTKQTKLVEGGLRTKGIVKKSCNNEKIITIITVVLNGEKYLEQTIQSVINQTYKNIEYIIIDGGSNDATTNILLKYEDEIDYWISEPDKGIYDAMNKGISLANGSWILFLGSDDCLFNAKTIENLLSENNNDSEIMLIYGKVLYKNGIYFKSKFNWKSLVRNPIHHQGAIYNSILFRKFRYNILYKIYADYELNLIIYLNKYKSIYKNTIISICGIDGASYKGIYTNKKEMHEIRKKYLNNIIMQLILSFILEFYICLKFIIINYKKIIGIRNPRI